ncbi:MAG: sigma-54-dependent Fis family transcriptional regulator [Crocinitomicaceae bacterium]|nr:sigma-54-dependent Fis family transcriptional regulator [Crocinitomicaceae bacterium]MBK9590542.1 sigma-54-dependent Fis family transcriptional regulator [Crocinitomicaceae bacterium]
MLNRLSVLLVDDSHDMLELLRRNMTDMGFNAFAASTVVDAIDVLENTEIDLVVTDLNMPHIGGMQLVKYMSQHFSQIPVLVITGFPDVRNAVEVMKLGAMEYLIKPFTHDELQASIEKVLGEIKVPQQKSGEIIESFHGIIGRSEPMQKLYHAIDKTKNNRATVLITGESGTGKEMVARAIHYNSAFSASPFVPVNCGAIPDQLLESELFGHMKGAFTGATISRAGFFQAAQGGTLFLDEISNASLTIQAKLLRVIQDKEITMLGATKSQKIDVRLISASNAMLDEQIKNGTFREDLFYRLNVITIHIPPLRDRKEDIPLLIDYFTNRYCKEYDKKPLKISKQIRGILTAYTWPGNVRELENFINRMVLMSDMQMNVDDIPVHMKMSSPKVIKDDLTMTLAEAEKNYIIKVLESCGNNKTKAAEILGIDRKTLREKLK